MLMERPLSVQSKTIICLNALSLEEKISGVTFSCILDKGVGVFFFSFLFVKKKHEIKKFVANVIKTQSTTL